MRGSNHLSPSVTGSIKAIVRFSRCPHLSCSTEDSHANLMAAITRSTFLTGVNFHFEYSFSHPRRHLILFLTQENFQNTYH